MLFNRMRALMDRVRTVIGTVDDKAYVRQDHRAILRLTLTGLVMAVAGGSAIGIVNGTGPLRWIALVVLLLILALNGQAGMKRALSYRDGWVDGRQAMITSLTEANERGMSLAEGVDAERARTLAAWGISITGSLGEQDKQS